MKRIFSLLLVVALLFTGCSSSQTPVLTVQPTADTTEFTEPTTDAATTPETPEPTEPTELPEATETPIVTEPTDPTEATEATDATESTQPPVTTDPPTQTEPPTATEPPKATEPPQTTKPSNSSSSSRPTSSATCRDSGSNEIWENPALNQMDYYEETDPERTDYVAEVLAFNNPYYFWVVEEDMRMYLGRTYGIVLVTSYDILMACEWTSSNPDVATVNHVGFVTPLQEGETVVTVSFTDPETQETISRTCQIRVENEPVYTLAQLEQAAKEEAEKIAKDIMNSSAFKSDLERIAAAAAIINQYVAKGHSTSYVKGYNQPFGTLITGYSSCAGSTRALGLVLEYMGFEWYHVNENQWDHQWCVVYDVDGQTAFADGSWVGVAGYGSWLTDQPYEYVTGKGLVEYTGMRPF